ncbi:hypothetical protein [Nonomuraea sp. NPDC046570]|uniref:hypothetical protein n=1 Tax=Nonomuraea sp. NPDC046570 TaxID=3155255 RepID=UPI0033BFC038
MAFRARMGVAVGMAGLVLACTAGSASASRGDDVSISPYRAEPGDPLIVEAFGCEGAGSAFAESDGFDTDVELEEEGEGFWVSDEAEVAPYADPGRYVVEVSCEDYDDCCDGGNGCRGGGDGCGDGCRGGGDGCGDGCRGGSNGCGHGGFGCRDGDDGCGDGGFADGGFADGGFGDGGRRSVGFFMVVDGFGPDTGGGGLALTANRKQAVQREEPAQSAGGQVGWLVGGGAVLAGAALVVARRRARMRG